MNINQIVKSNPDGFSIDIKSMSLIDIKTHKPGYIVGITNNKVKPTDIETAFIKMLKIANTISADKVYIGGWYSKEQDVYFLDVSVFVTGRVSAECLKTAFNQEEYFEIPTTADKENKGLRK